MKRYGSCSLGCLLLKGCHRNTVAICRVLPTLSLLDITWLRHRANRDGMIIFPSRVDPASFVPSSYLSFDSLSLHVQVGFLGPFFFFSTETSCVSAKQIGNSRSYESFLCAVRSF